MFKNKWRKADRSARAQAVQLSEQQQPPIPKQHYLEGNCHRVYSCVHCRAHLANHDELISKLFQGNHGRAYLFNRVVNIGCKQAVERELLTGLHAVADIYCDSCETTLGWKYEQAFVPSQKYKEGKYIIELVHILKENYWDLTSHNTEQLLSDHESRAGPVTNNYWFRSMVGRLSSTKCVRDTRATAAVATTVEPSDQLDQIVVDEGILSEVIITSPEVTASTSAGEDRDGDQATLSRSTANREIDL